MSNSQHPQPDPMEHNKELEEHIFTPMPSGTGMKCSCGKSFGTMSEQQQHLNWHLKLAALINQEKDKVLDAAIDRAIKYIRSGKVAGSFSEGCDCEKCDTYEHKVRKALHNLHNSEIREGQ